MHALKGTYNLRMFSVANITITKVKSLHKSRKYICPVTKLTVLNVNSSWNSYIFMSKKKTGPHNDPYSWLHLLAININHHCWAFPSIATYTIIVTMQFSDYLVSSYSASLKFTMLYGTTESLDTTYDKEYDLNRSYNIDKHHALAHTHGNWFGGG